MSRGKVVNRVFVLRDELQKYIQGTNKQDFAMCFEDVLWLQRLSYIADIFHHKNQMNKSLRGPGKRY